MVVTQNLGSTNTRPMTMETRCCKVFFPKCSKKKSAENTLVPPLLEKREKNISVFCIICSHCCTRWNMCFHVENSRRTRWSKTAPVTIGLWSRHRINPPPTRLVSCTASKCRWRPRIYQVDPWYSRRGRDVARGVLRSSPKNLVPW